MAHIACPTCAHSFHADDSQFEAIIVCPKCKLSLRCQDNVAPEPQSQTANKSDQRLPHSENVQSPPKALNGGTGIAVIALLIIIVAKYASPTSNSPPGPSSTEYTNDPVPAYSGPVAPPQQNHTGRVNYSLVNTFQNLWRKEGWRHKSKNEQVKCMALMIAIVQTDIDVPADRQATLDYIQRTIDSW